jgi:hypothetical protein
MDLTKEFPRSPNDMMAGIVSLPRMIDKTHAYNDGTLGDYDVDCPHDKPVLALLGIDFPTFAAKVKALGYDNAAIAAWATTLLASKTPQELAAFNDARRHWGPDEHSMAYFKQLHDAVAPGRTDVTTWFALLDLDEHRQPTAA